MPCEQNTLIRRLLGLVRYDIIVRFYVVESLMVMSKSKVGCDTGLDPNRRDDRMCTGAEASCRKTLLVMPMSALFAATSIEYNVSPTTVPTFVAVC